MTGRDLDVRAIADASTAADCGVAHAAGLLRLVEAAHAGEAAPLAAARDALREEVGSRVLVDAAAVIANFERMTRIAEATGIPLDAPAEMMSADLRGDLGLDGFASAGRTPRGGALRRILAGLLRPALLGALKLASRTRGS